MDTKILRQEGLPMGQDYLGICHILNNYVVTFGKNTHNWPAIPTLEGPGERW